MRGIVENLPCGVSVFDADLVQVASNRKYRQILGFPDARFEPERPRFESFIRFNAERGAYGPGNVDEIVAPIVERARAPAQPHRVERTRPDGTPVEVQGAPMPGGGFVTTDTDVSERKRAEAEVARSSALLRGAIEAIDEVFVVHDPDDRLVLCNERSKEIDSGVRDLIVPGARFEDLVRAGAERGDYLAARGRVDEWVRERVAAHQAANGTILQELDDGTTLRIVERRLPDGHVVGFRIDVTELTRARRSAAAASRAKSQFLANMSHEIRAPMNAVLGLLNDILEFSKAEAGRMVLEPQPLRVDELLRDLSVTLSAGIGAKPVEVLFHVDAALPPVLIGDAMRLRQILHKLGGNAIEFTERGEVVVQVAVAARHEIEIRLSVGQDDEGRRGPAGLRALVVDDNPAARDLLRGMVGSLGWQAEVAEDGERALQILQAERHRIDAVFVDWAMHGLDGWQLCERIRGDALAVGAPVLVMVTAHGREELAQRSDAEQDLLEGFLVKPVTSSMPLDAVVDARARAAPAVGRTGTEHGPASTGGRLQGLRLLLAEDNENNQQVARELLEDEGASVLVADNGRLAGEALIADGVA